VGLIGAEFVGWLPHLHLNGFVPPGLHRDPGYVAAVMVAFIITLLVSASGVSAIMVELRRQWAWQAQAKEQELTATTDKLAELDRMRSFFLGLASHDLKTPLAVVSNYLQTILGGFTGEISVSNEQQRRWMERANARVLELVRLIDDFLDVSQLDPERVLSEMKQIDLGDLIRQSLDEVRVKAGEKEVVVQVRLPDTLPPVYGAPRRVRRVLVNLLDNAITCSPRSGQVWLEVHLSDDDDQVQVDVVDAGPCIPKRYLPHVFDDYFQVQRKQFVPGAGLGLSTARKIVELHRGQIWVVSPCFEGGVGSRFSFVLLCSLPDRPRKEEIGGDDHS